MAILAYCVFGFIIGTMLTGISSPPKNKLTFPLNVAAIIIAAIFGGLVANMIMGHDMLAIHSAGFIGSVLAAFGFGLVVCPPIKL